MENTEKEASEIEHKIVIMEDRTEPVQSMSNEKTDVEERSSQSIVNDQPEISIELIEHQMRSISTDSDTGVEIETVIPGQVQHEEMANSTEPFTKSLEEESSLPPPQITEINSSLLSTNVQPESESRSLHPIESTIEDTDMQTTLTVNKFDDDDDDEGPEIEEVHCTETGQSTIQLTTVDESTSLETNPVESTIELDDSVVEPVLFSSDVGGNNSADTADTILDDDEDVLMEGEIEMEQPVTSSSIDANTIVESEDLSKDDLPDLQCVDIDDSSKPATCTIITSTATTILASESKENVLSNVFQGISFTICEDMDNTEKVYIVMVY